MMRDGKTWALIILLMICGVLMFRHGGPLSSYAADDVQAPVARMEPIEATGPVEPCMTGGVRPGMDRVLGFVVNGQMVAVPDENDREPGTALRLTKIKIIEAKPPEAEEIFLYEYEGAAIMVEGMVDSGWVYEASIVDIGGPIVNEIVRRMLP